VVRRAASLSLAFAVLLGLNSAQAMEGWARLKTGMTPQEARTALGPPLMRTSGHGYELWFYDCSAEVVFYNGPVVAWTVPVANAEAASRPIASDVTLLPGAPLVRRAPAPYRGDEGGDPWSDTEFRYRQRR
jgi:hypothetical protein